MWDIDHTYHWKYQGFYYTQRSKWTPWNPNVRCLSSSYFLFVRYKHSPQPFVLKRLRVSDEVSHQYQTTRMYNEQGTTGFDAILMTEQRQRFLLNVDNSLPDKSSRLTPNSHHWTNLKYQTRARTQHTHTHTHIQTPHTTKINGDYVLMTYRDSGGKAP